MGLFKSEEQKKLEREEKQNKQLQKLVSKYNLNNMSKSDLETLQRISNDLAGTGLMKAGMSLSFAKTEDQAKVSYLSALVEQNWLIIKLLSDMNRKIDNLLK